MYRAAGVFSGKALADCKLPLLEIPQHRRKCLFLFKKWLTLVFIVIAYARSPQPKVITGEWVLVNGVISLARSWRGLGTVFSIIWPSGLCQNPSIIRYRAAGVFSGKALADWKLPLLEIPQYRGKIDFLRTCPKRCVFWSLPLSSRLYRVCLRGARGRASRRQKWFSLRKIAKSIKTAKIDRKT